MEQAHSPQKPLFVVTGCPRSGTLFTARALAALGHACGHEALFGPETTAVPDFGSAQGDVSWLAVPFLADLPAGTVVVHQVRHPLQVLRSLVAQRFFQTRPHPLMGVRYRLQYRHIRFARPVTNPRFVRFAARHCPGIFDLPGEVARAAHWWVVWNRRAEAAAGLPGLRYLRVRVEDLDATGLTALSAALGGTATTADAALVLAALGTATHHGRTVPPVVLDAIPAPQREPLVALAAAYGYEV
jgi:hypothetical protein